MKSTPIMVKLKRFLFRTEAIVMGLSIMLKEGQTEGNIMCMPPDLPASRGHRWL